jgi:hypothetical protein
MMTIINDTADRMPNATWEIGQKQVDNLKLLPSAYNWDHNRVASNHVSLLKLSPVTALNSLITVSSCWRFRLPTDTFSRCIPCSQSHPHC